MYKYVCPLCLRCQTCSSAGRALCSDGCPVCLRRSGWRRRRAMATPLSQVHPEAPFAKPPPPHLSRRGGVAVAKSPSIGSSLPKMPPGRWGPFAATQLASSGSGLPSEANDAWANGTPMPLEAAPTDSGPRRENNEVGVDLNPMPLEAAPTDSGLPREANDVGFDGKPTTPLEAAPADNLLPREAKDVDLDGRPSQLDAADRSSASDAHPSEADRLALEEGLPPGWRVRWHGPSKRWRYVDYQLRKSFWKRPPPPCDRRNWARALDFKGRPYWFNRSLHLAFHEEGQKPWIKYRAEGRLYWSSKSGDIRFYLDEEGMSDVIPPAPLDLSEYWFFFCVVEAFLAHFGPISTRTRA